MGAGGGGGGRPRASLRATGDGVTGWACQPWLCGGGRFGGAVGEHASVDDGFGDKPPWASETRLC